ncbi:3-oxoacyl-ACP reductase FabG [Knoellia locipacati]|uniref:3-oxoacyl-ACP reductase FabG n=1 Tax=Knoellia locipacati TaxID=882824 RepID=UPI003850C88F
MALLENKVAVVTGGAQGIGLEIARAFIREGARVVIGDINKEAGAAAVAELGGDEVARFVHCDVRSTTDVDVMLRAAEESFGPIDVMVNNAGMTRDATMRRMSEQDFDDVIAVHLRGAWNGTRAAAERMRERETGSIINISSISGKVGMLGQTNYSAAKAGIVGLTKAACKEVGFKNVRVNAIQPGYIRTAMTEAMPEAVKEQKKAEIPMGRPGEAVEVANVAVFLASDLSSYMSGTVLEVSGGRHI